MTGALTPKMTAALRAAAAHDATGGLHRTCDGWQPYMSRDDSHNFRAVAELIKRGHLVRVYHGKAEAVRPTILGESWLIAAGYTPDGAPAKKTGPKTEPEEASHADA